MFVKWIQRVFFGAQGQNAAGAPATTPAKPGETVDVVHKAMQAQAAELGGIVSASQAQQKREAARQRARAKVKDSIDPMFANDFLVDEITERLVEAAEFDPNFRSYTEE